MRKVQRENLSDEATVYLDEIYAQGTFKLVYEGIYTCGPRENETAMIKMFKSGSIYEDLFFATELNVISTAMDIIRKFNDGDYINRHIYLNQPAIWRYVAGSRRGQKVLVEPFIENFQKFNSNSGWTDYDGTPWNLVMQALSHFSYHNSGGSLVLCDLQGGIYKDGAVLTDPVVMSANKKYGPADLGREGIITFFARHRCNRFCRSEWTKPRNPVAYFDEEEGTSMTIDSIVPSRYSRNLLTHH